MIDHLRCLEGCTHDRSRDLERRQRFTATKVVATRAMIEDLPVVSGHVIAAGIERTPGENPDAPIKGRVEVLLRKDQGGLLQQLVQLLHELRSVLNLKDTE